MNITKTMKANSKIVTVIIIVLLLCIAASIHFHHSTIKNPAITPPPTLVQVQKPIQQSIALTEQTTGYLVANKSTTITPQASGYIRAINFKEGQAVTQGELLFKLDSQTQKNALDSATANENLSKLHLARDKKLLTAGYITHNVYYTANVTDQQNQAALQTAQTNYAQRSITAPFSGTIGAINTSIGDYINPGTALTTLVDNQHLRAEYTLPVKNLNQLQLNQPVLIESSTGRHKINATVSYVAPAIDQSTQTIAVHATVDNSAGLFRPGEYVTITQRLGTTNNALLVPEQSVLASISGYSVFIAKNNKAIRSIVTIGQRINGNVVITSGLTPTDNVITAGQNEVKNNASIKIERNDRPKHAQSVAQQVRNQLTSSPS